MPKKDRNVLNFIDRFPFIIFIVIALAAFLIFINVINRLPLSFFSGEREITESEDELMVFISSPVNEREYELVSQNETIPIEIKAKEIEDVAAVIKVFINDDEVNTFSSPPYEMNWSPLTSGTFEMQAHLMDDNGTLISSSEKINFSVKYTNDQEDLEESGPVSIELDEKKNNILENAVYREQNGPPLFSYKAYKEFDIDADLVEWGYFEKFSAFGPTIKKENYTNAQDISGVFSSSWDEDNFYFVIKVVDDIINQPYTSNQINRGDCISLAFDTDLEGDMQIPFLNDDDFLIELSPGNFAENRAESFVRWPSNAPLKDAQISSKRTSDGYILEAVLPWSNFSGFVPEDETVIGFTVSIMDTDNLVDENEMLVTELVISSSKQFDFNNLLTLGTLIFIDVGDIEELQQVIE
jgi:hypothetical protein